MHPIPGPWSDPIPVSPVTVVPIVSGRGTAQPSPVGIVVEVVDACVVVVECTVLDATAVVVVTVDVVGGTQIVTPSRWQRLRIPRRQPEFRLAKTPQVAE